MTTHLPDTVSPAALHPLAAKAVADIDAMEARDRRAVVSRHECMAVGGWKLSSQVKKEQAGELVSLLDGPSRKVTTASLYRHLRDLAIATWPADGPPRKGRNPTSGFKKRAARRKPSPQELAALQRANARRRDEAMARRKEAKSPQPESA
jgi:hypothetical protein